MGRGVRTRAPIRRRCEGDALARPIGSRGGGASRGARVPPTARLRASPKRRRACQGGWGRGLRRRGACADPPCCPPPAVPRTGFPRVLVSCGQLRFLPADLRRAQAGPMSSSIVSLSASSASGKARRPNRRPPRKQGRPLRLRTRLSRI